MKREPHGMQPSFFRRYDQTIAGISKCSSQNLNYLMKTNKRLRNAPHPASLSEKQLPLYGELYSYDLPSAEPAPAGSKVKTSVETSVETSAEASVETSAAATQKTPQKPSPTTHKSSEIGSEKSSEKIIHLLRVDPKKSAAELAAAIGLSPRGVEKQIAKLRQDGRLRRVGPDKGGHWEVIGKDDFKG